MHAADGAVRRAPLGTHELAADVVESVLFERRPGCASLLRTPVHQTVLADVQVAAARPAVPVVWPAFDEILLKPAYAGVQVLEDLLSRADEPRDVVEHGAFSRTERLQQAVAVVNDPERRREAQLARAQVDVPRVLRIFHAAADDRIDVDVE